MWGVYMKGKNLRLWGLGFTHHALISRLCGVVAMTRLGIKFYYNFHKAHEELGEFYENPNAHAGTR